MLFELCYPMYTGMERNICLSQLRNLIFPDDWNTIVEESFPMLRGLITRMLDRKPSDRPTAKSTVQALQSILEEFTILQLDNTHGPDIMYFRVEADFREDILRYTKHHIQSSDGGAYSVVDHALRGVSSRERTTAIMEFALESPDPQNMGPKLVASLSKMPHIHKVRHVPRMLSS
jgi:hypothetical protein